MEVLNEVVLNQVLFRFDSDDRTAAVLKRVQEGGVAWMSGTTWQGRGAIRISVSNWSTTEDDVDRTIAEFARRRRPRGCFRQPRAVPGAASGAVANSHQAFRDGSSGISATTR